jgi:glycosyltransferase involved in cell wall biosynthesis
LVEEKGIDVLLRAAVQLPPYSWRIVLVGSGPYQSQIESQIAELGIADFVAIHPPVPSTEMPAQYHQIHALVLPSLTRPNWKEQFGRVLIEAMASGIPVIGSDSGAIPDVIGDAGLVFPEGDPDVLAVLLRQLQETSYVRASLGEKGRARVLEHFTYDQIATATVDVYREIMDNQHS